MELISRREYARRRGVSHVSVLRAIRDGRIKTVKGKIDPVRADRDWDANTDRSKPRNSVSGDPRRRKVPGAAPVPMPLDGPGGGNGDGRRRDDGPSYARARAAREAIQAQIAKLTLDERLGILVRRDEVRLAAFNAARRTRDKLLALPERVAVVVAAVSDPVEVQRILENEVERICSELSGDDAGRE